jgi:hypothetical protein
MCQSKLTLWHTIFITHGAPINNNFLGKNGGKRSIYNLKIDTIYTYDIPFDRAYLQLSDGIRHVMPSTYRKLELKARYRWLRPSHSQLCINQPSEPGRLRDGCVCQRVNSFLVFKLINDIQSHSLITMDARFACAQYRAVCPRN